MITIILTGILLTVAPRIDEASLRERFMISRLGEDAYRARQNAAAELDGKMLVVRRYGDWKNAPAEFERLRVRLTGSRVALEPDDAALPPVVVITAEDQEEEVVRKAVGDCVCVLTVTKRQELRLPFAYGHDPERQRWQFTDALGEPLAGAAAEIWLAEYQGPRIRFGRTTLDDAGGLAWKTVIGKLRTVYFTVSHPDYGCAEVGEMFDSDRKLIVPVVRRGTVAAERAIHGRVVDPNGVPVAGATIQCESIRTLGEGLINGRGRLSTGLTDPNGVFSFYMPNSKSRDDRGELIPLKSQYHVRIDAPKKFGLLPYVRPIENGRETRVVLERGDRVRRLRFEDSNGTITDPAKLATISVWLRQSDRSMLVLRYDDWKEGAPLIPGTYEASMYGSHGESRFEPVELTRDSPPEVVFSLPAAVTYYGRVVHGITGQPMAGAFVLAMSGGGEGARLHELTAEQWEALHRLAGDLPANDTAFESLHLAYNFTKLVRTDATGSYSVTREPDQGLYGFIVFEQDYLAVMYRKHSLQAGPDHYAEVPTIKLFPAATVFVEPAVDSDYLPVMPRWTIDEGTRPAWVEELLSMDSGRESALEYSRWLKLNTSQRVPVPAGVSLRLKLETPYNEEFCPILIPQVIYLGQGETADLGRFTFEPALAVQVRAVDAVGQSLEGIPIRKLCVGSDGKRAWSVPHNTDEQGLARFHVVPNSTGSFGVFCGSRESGPLNATVDYEVGGPEDAGREFVLRLSDEMLAQLLQGTASGNP